MPRPIRVDERSCWAAKLLWFAYASGRWFCLNGWLPRWRSIQFVGLPKPFRDGRLNLVPVSDGNDVRDFGFRRAIHPANLGGVHLAAKKYAHFQKTLFG